MYKFHLIVMSFSVEIYFRFNFRIAPKREREKKPLKFNGFFLLNSRSNCTAFMQLPNFIFELISVNLTVRVNYKFSTMN